MPILEATRDAFGLIAQGDAALLQVIWISLKTSLIALAIAAPDRVAITTNGNSLIIFTRP